MEYNMFFVQFLCKYIRLIFISFFITIFSSHLTLASNVLNVNKDEKDNLLENENDINQQLNDYKTVSKWIIDNQNEFQKVLAETAKKSSTKWVIENNIKNTESLELPVKPQNTPVENNIQNRVYHIVKEKETLYSISKMYNITPQEIISLNKLSKDGYIHIGQKLLIKENNDIINLSPLDNNVEETAFESGAFIYPQYKYYQVVEGDTIYSISKAVNMSPEYLIKFNNLDKIQIYPGMILKIQANYNNISKSNNVNKFEWPLIGRLLISFGPQKTGMVSEGINIMARKGTPVKSVADGVVIYVGNGVKALGNLILIQHKSGWVSVYGYLDNNMAVKKGQEVKVNQVIGYVGKTNNIKIPQLHFELRENVIPKDPLEYLNSYT